MPIMNECQYIIESDSNIEMQKLNKKLITVYGTGTFVEHKTTWQKSKYRPEKP